MSNAIWMIIYDLKNVRKDEYLQWFHNVHIPKNWPARVILGPLTIRFCAMMRKYPPTMDI